ncbi:conserved hypothetical protein [Leishmania braziliensis MHOM/BR/75/M2904]|uniref:Ubiquitin-like domain-containing protein n=2 Tax=Leishmania braziliensis TaxID=5660 RepID=A4HLL0_LEIBR|nr:conserved hypothetical protein [Leishmania braziliensis MHOM/BR/75/M2904]CAJ2479469.1 unnamed protein product [Leishmania braziliensis]CAM40706.1 conserved hypothetical protein [Leishmania braziliensis MHOM/BR/75/M2904]SYZ69114.1 hypothetical_protein [Leishmania braziliensis MHOM/BR/75/M2904]
MASYHPAPLPVRFDSNVSLTLHQAFLSTAGVLLCDPVARVHVVTIKTLHAAPPPSVPKTNSNSCGVAAAEGGIRIVLNSKEVAKSKPHFFTTHPSFNETFNFTVAETSALTSLSIPGHAVVDRANAAAQGRRKQVDGGVRNTGSGTSESVVDYIVVTIESADGTAFYGEAYAPFSPHCTSAIPAATPVRVMLTPRNAQDAADPLFLQDNALLEAKHLDDFGFVTMSWEVAVVPRGGALMGTEPMLTSSSSSSPPSAAPFPVGLTLRATWLARAAAYVRGAHYTTSVEFGGQDRFIFSNPQQPLCLTLHGGSAEAALHRAVLHCSVQSVVDPTKSHDVAVPLPLPPLTSAAARNRDVRWTAPVRTINGVDLGLLLVTMRVSSKPLSTDPPRCPDAACTRVNDPVHQEEYQHVAELWEKSQPPQVPPGAYQPIAWESQVHVLEAAQRQRKRQCILEAQPTAEHVRHIFDVLMGRASLDAGVARVAATFSSKNPAEVTAGDLREMMVGCAFHAAQLSVQDAARFCFVALRRDVEDAVAAEEVQYIVDHCLLEKTIEMPTKERKRLVTDLFANVPTVSYHDFAKYMLHNYALWATLGVPLTVDESASNVQRQHAALLHTPGAGGVLLDVATLPPPSQGSIGAPVTAGAATATQGSAVALAAALADPASSAVWRTFVVRVAQTPQKAFSVTAHAADRISDVMAMVEGSTGIKAECQEWRVVSGGAEGFGVSSTTAQKSLDPATLVGSTTLGLPSALRNGPAQFTSSTSGGNTAQEVWIYEAEETIQVRFHVKDRLHNKKDWQERLPVKEKVLKVRAVVQRKTLIPLSRCTLTLKRSNGLVTKLQDRHTLAHYHLGSGDVIEVSHD